MNDNKKVMRVHESEDKSFKVSAKSKRHSIVGNRCVNGLHVATSLSQKKKKKKEGLIIHDSMRKPNSLIVSLFIFWCLGLSLCDFYTYEMNSLTSCLNSFLFLKWSFFGSLSLPSTVRTPAKKKSSQEIAYIYIKTERHPAHESKTWLTGNNNISSHPLVPSKINQKAKIRQLQMNVLALVFKTQYETIKLYTVLGTNN